MRGDVEWRYEGVTHEYPCSDEPDIQENLDALVIEDHADGGCRSDKFERDARLLRRELERDPHNPRTVFYLANTERDLGHAEEAIALYERRAAMGGWGEEVYCSLLEAGVLRAEQTDDWAGAMDSFSRAWSHVPSGSKPATNSPLGCACRAATTVHTPSSAPAFSPAGGPKATRAGRRDRERTWCGGKKV